MFAAWMSCGVYIKFRTAERCKVALTYIEGGISSYKMKGLRLFGRIGWMLQPSAHNRLPMLVRNTYYRNGIDGKYKPQHHKKFIKFIHTKSIIHAGTLKHE